MKAKLMSAPFRVGLTRDFLKPDGSLGFGDIGLSLLDKDPHVHWEFISESPTALSRDIADQYDALLVLAPRVTAATLDGCKRLAVVARFGVGYDNVDVAACTRNDILLTITPEGVRRPVAVSAITFVLALSQKLLIKDRLTRTGRWSEKLNHMGIGVTGKTLGLIGLGNIGLEVASLIRPFGMRVVASDPFANAEQAAATDVQLMPLEQLLTQSDFVCVCCALNPATHHLLNADRLGLMKPSAYLINVARGPIIDQAAMTQFLTDGRIAGAGLDVFEQEPVDPQDPLLKMENVIVSPHAICWTDELFLGNGRAACQSILDVAIGRYPKFVVNRDVVDRPGLLEKLNRFAAASTCGQLPMNSPTTI